MRVRNALDSKSDVRGDSRSVALEPFDRLHMTASSTVTTLSKK